MSENLRALMESGLGPDSQLQLAKRAGVSQSTVGRALSGHTRATVETVGRIAKVYGLSPWQLLVPDLDPRAPPALVAADPAEREALDRLRLAAQELAKYRP